MRKCEKVRHEINSHRLLLYTSKRIYAKKGLTKCNSSKAEIQSLTMFII